LSLMVVTATRRGHRQFPFILPVEQYLAPDRGLSLL
jgi:hypothetical protein